jgi:protein ImuB
VTGEGQNSTRMMVVWCPDWPVVAWGVDLYEPSAVVVANRVIATSPAAREYGVRSGQRRRDAQSKCSELAVLERDEEREARLFEPVACALETLTPRIEVSGPGLLGFPTRGPSRYFGGDHSLAHQVVSTAGKLLANRGEVRVGVADGVFAARLAARSTAARKGPAIVPEGDSAEFLSPINILTLSQPKLTDVLSRLGLTTLGSFAALKPADVVGRFGAEGQVAHRLASGDDEHPPDLRRPEPDLATTWNFDPPTDRIDTCAFAAKALADELHAALDARGLACTRVGIEAETVNGQLHHRLWRHEGTLSASALADRARWQLDGWNLRNTNGGGVSRLTLIPDEVVPATGRQLGLWGGRAERADDITRVITRLQVMLGPEAVTVPEWQGGRGPTEQIRLIPAATVDVGEPRPSTELTWVSEPWPGKLPPPTPAQIYPDPVPIQVLSAAGVPVGVNGRGEISVPPALVGSQKVLEWAGPWPSDERWWDPLTHRRRARVQVVLADGAAHLLVVEHRTWHLEATYN